MRKLNAHLEDINESYFEHMAHALWFALNLAIAGLCCLVHGFLPFLFQRSGSRRVERLYQTMVVNRHRLGRRNRESRQAMAGKPGPF